MITPQEYIQLKAFARQDGALLSLLWIGSVACYIKGLTSPLLAIASLALLAASPFYAASRLRHFRDYGREGIISFKRGYAYTVLTFFYAGLLLAAAVFVYFTFIDQGYLLSKFSEMSASAQGREMIELYGLGEQIDSALTDMQEMRPVDYALNMLSISIMAGFVFGFPTALVMQRSIIRKV